MERRFVIRRLIFGGGGERSSSVYFVFLGCYVWVFLLLFMVSFVVGAKFARCYKLRTYQNITKGKRYEHIMNHKQRNPLKILNAMNLREACCEELIFD